MQKAILSEIHHGQTDELLYKVVWVWCPGCDEIHQFVVEHGSDRKVPVWNWDGDLECPTFSPSMLVTWTISDSNSKIESKVCHSFLKDGIWDFLSDSTHMLAGTKASMVELPEWVTKV